MILSMRIYFIWHGQQRSACSKYWQQLWIIVIVAQQLQQIRTNETIITMRWVVYCTHFNCTKKKIDERHELYEWCRTTRKWCSDMDDEWTTMSEREKGEEPVNVLFSNYSLMNTKIHEQLNAHTQIHDTHDLCVRVCANVHKNDSLRVSISINCTTKLSLHSFNVRSWSVVIIIGAAVCCLLLLMRRIFINRKKWNSYWHSWYFRTNVWTK